MNVITKTVQLPDGRTISIETGKVAKQADGAAVLRMNNTVLLATVTAAKDSVAPQLRPAPMPQRRNTSIPIMH